MNKKKLIRNWHRKKIVTAGIFTIMLIMSISVVQTEGKTLRYDSNLTKTSIVAPKHVIVIVFENQELNDILNKGPYFNYLYNTYGSASNYYAACHPSASNYLAMTSGNTWECGSDAVNLFTTNNIGTLLQNKSLSWYGFMESMPSACYRSGSGRYVPRHNPFIYYTDLVNSNLCKEHDVPLSNWTDLVNSDDPNKIPNFSFISPNLDNDGHDTNISYADNWLKGFLEPLLVKSWANDSVFFIVFDEGKTNNGYNGFTGGHTYLVAVSPYSKGLSVASDATEYNLLTTIEWLLSLGTTGNNDDPLQYPPMKGLFNLPNIIGDINNDGTITVSDALLYLRYSVGQDISPYHIDTSDDVTCDGVITVSDALKVLRKAVGQDVNLQC